MRLCIPTGTPAPPGLVNRQLISAQGNYVLVGQSVTLTYNSLVATGWPDATNTGYASHPSYPGSLTNNAQATFSTSGTYNFQRFGGATITAGTHVFNGCQFASNSVDAWNVRITGGSVTFNNCTMSPPVGVTIPNANWPCAGTDVPGVDGFNGAAAYQIAHNAGYQYGVRIEGSSGVVISKCDIWGFGNAIDLVGGSNTQILDCWIHDAAFEGTGSGQYHTDGPGYLDGGGGPNNVTIRHCTIASLGNTNAIAFQAATSGYNGIVVDNCYLTGFGITVDMLHGASFARNCKFINNVVTNRCLAGFRLLRGDEPTPFAVSQTTNEWRNNTLIILRNGSGYTTADNGKFLLPSGNTSSTDYVDGFP